MASRRHQDSSLQRVLPTVLALVVGLSLVLVAPHGGRVDAATQDPSGEFTALTPARIVDTREGLGLGGTPVRLQGGTVHSFQVAGQGGVPAAGVAAVVVNVTVVQPSTAGWLRIWPSGATQPPVSNVNFVAGQTVANLATVGLGADGKVSVLAPWGQYDLVLDVTGFYASTSGPAGGRFHGVTPFRALDTRLGPGLPLGAGESTTIPVTGVGDVPASGAVAVALTVTAVWPTAATFLTVHPADVVAPWTSNLNPAAQQTVANAAVIRLPEDGRIAVRNGLGSTHIVVDVVGYYDTDRSSEAGRFVTVDAQRLVDTRMAVGALGPQHTDRISVLDAVGSTPAWVGAVMVNLTAVEPTAHTWLTAYPADALPQLSSNVNLVPGQVHAASVMVGSSAPTSRPAVAFDVFNHSGAIHLVVDIFGVFTNESAPWPVALPAPRGALESLGAGPPTAVHGDGYLPVVSRPTNYTAWTGDPGYPVGTGIWFLDRLRDGRLLIGSMTPTNSPEAQVVNTMVVGIYTPPSPGVPARFERVDVGRIVRPVGTDSWSAWSTIPVPATPIGGGDVSDVCVVQQATADGGTAERVLALSAVPRKFLGEAATVGQYPGVVVIDPSAAKGTGPVDGRIDLVESETTSELAADAPPGAFPPSLSWSPVSQLTECDTSAANVVVASQYATPVTDGNPTAGVPPSNGNGAVMVLDPNGEQPDPLTGDGRLTVPAALPLGQVTFVLDDGTADPPTVTMHPRDVKVCPCSIAKTRFAIVYDGTYVDKATGATRAVHPLQLFGHDPASGRIVPLSAPFVSGPDVDFNTADEFADDGSLFVSRSAGLGARSMVHYAPTDIPAPDPSMTMLPGQTVKISTYPTAGPGAIGTEIPQSAWRVAADGWTDATAPAFSRSMTVVDDGDDDPRTSAILTVAGNGVARVLRWDSATRSALAYCDRDLYGRTPFGGRWLPSAGVPGAAAIVRQGDFDPSTGLYEVPVNVFLTGTPAAVDLPMYLASIDARAMFAGWRVRTSEVDTCAGRP